MAKIVSQQTDRGLWNKKVHLESLMGCADGRDEDRRVELGRIINELVRRHGSSMKPS